jgi:hypothetical protein
VPNPLLQGSGQVRLIEIARIKNGILNRHAVFEEGRRTLRTFNLSNVCLCQTGAFQEPMTQGSRREVSRSILQDATHHGIGHQQASPHKSVDEDIGMFKIWKLPDRTIQPEGLIRRFRQKRFAVQEIPGRQVRHQRAEFEFDPQQLCTLAVGHEASGGQWSNNQGSSAPVMFDEDHVPVILGGPNRGTIAGGSTSSDGLHQRRV